jgi:pyridoxamine 5'-phosphate oxidase
MKNNLAHIRTDYSSQSLDCSDVLSSPTKQFELWMNQAIEAGALEATAMNLSTVDTNGKPTSRIVLLKGLEENRFVFFTNYSSHKGIDLAHLPFGALNFFWPELERQVRIEGNIEKVSTTDSDTYFSSRPYASKIGAWVSEQSKKISSRDELEKRIEIYQSKYPEGTEVPRPEHWGGYALTPRYIEFWQGRPSRLHDRIVYEMLADGGWEIYRICP